MLPAAVVGLNQVVGLKCHVVDTVTLLDCTRIVYRTSICSVSRWETANTEVRLDSLAGIAKLRYGGSHFHGATSWFYLCLFLGSYH